MHLLAPNIQQRIKWLAWTLLIVNIAFFSSRTRIGRYVHNQVLPWLVTSEQSG